MTLSSLHTTTSLAQPTALRTATHDARQLEHLRVADEMEARLRSLPRVGATLTAQALFHGAWAHRMMSEMTLAEEKEWLAEGEAA